MAKHQYYTGRKPCGCTIAACLDMPDFKSDTAEFAKDCIKDGLILEYHDTNNTPDLKSCKCGKTEELFVEG